MSEIVPTTYSIHLNSVLWKFFSVGDSCYADVGKMVVEEMGVGKMGVGKTSFRKIRLGSWVLGTWVLVK